MVLFIMLFALVVVWQLIKRGFIRPLMGKGWFRSFDMETIADQLVVEVSNYHKERRLKTEDSVVSLNASTSQDQSMTEDIGAPADTKTEDAL